MTPFPLFLALKYLKPRRTFASVILVITVLGVALGVAILMIVLAVMTGFGEVWREKILSFKPHITIYHDSGFLEEADAVADRVAAVPGVASATPTIISPVMIRYHEEDEPVTATFIGLDIARGSVLTQATNHLIGGNADIAGNRVLVGIDLARRMGLRLGSEFLCYSPLNLKSADELYFPEEMVLAGVYEMDMRDYDDFIVIGSLGLAREIIGADVGARIVQAQIREPEQAWREREAIAAAIAADFGPGYRVSTWLEEDRVLFEALRTEKTMMFILLAFIAIVAAFCVTNTLIVITIQKTREIGLLKALGFSGRQLKAAFVLHGMIQCVAGIALGVALGYLVLVNLQNLVALLHRFDIEVFPKSIYGFAQIPWRIVPGDVVAVVATVFVFCTVASYLPAWRAARMDPVKAINEE
ncbi:MAG: ABC transporter permease [Kiritimatiellia bacterium]|jgi:lipoprotein-releasing system permease protein